MKYINIHTHNPSDSKTTFEIINYFPEQEIEKNHYCSVGLHPWFIKNITDNNWVNIIKKKLDKKNVVAIGETGLDKITSIDYRKQIEIFEQHIEIAQEKQLPVFIHCVKAFSDILWYKKQDKDSTPWIIHGFSANQQIANELIKHGCYLSFGKDLCYSHKKIKDYFAELPIDKIFFETDDDLGNTIEEIYGHASTLLKIPVDDLKQQIYFNFEQIFPGILKNEKLATAN